jgi:hypothetical protein
MPIRTTEPRLPLEPEEYPLYRPPRRFGCSGLTIVTLLTIGIFVLLLWKVTPDMAKGLTDPLKKLVSGGTPAIDTTPGSGSFATLTAVAAKPTNPPVVVVPTSTPVILYVQVGNNSGANVSMRKEATLNSNRVLSLKGGEIVQVISPDEKDPDNPQTVWRHVQLLCGDGRNGWIQAKYLIEDAVPPPCPTVVPTPTRRR